MYDEWYNTYEDPEMDELCGRTFKEVVRDGDRIIFKNDTTMYVLERQRDCCAQAWLEDINGDLEDLQGVPIAEAYRSTNKDDAPPPGRESQGSHTWTFTRIRTIKGTVVIRFFGTSNGYYSESAELRQYELL